VNDIFSTIKYGVPEKGMISWKSQLRPAAMQKVASYILTFQGTNPENQKAPEGELYESQETEENNETLPEENKEEVG
jgi:cytochrome c oxidase cbb3-type subunit 3